MQHLGKVILCSLVVFSILSCNAQATVKSSTSEKVEKSNLDNFETAYFASGCFWCVEAVFESVKGVEEVISGYSGGNKKNANYSAVSSGKTNHAEAVEVYYNPDIVSYETLLKVFFGSQDPTTPNQQGPDRGPQYRSAIFYKNMEEKTAAENYIQKLTDDKVFSKPIVTEIVPFDVFYDAEDYHQDYEKTNPNQPYVRAVSIPRLKKFQAKYPELLKDNHQ